MELVELPSRTELEQENDAATHTQTQTQDGPLATGIKKRGLFFRQPSSSKRPDS